MRIENSINFLFTYVFGNMSKIPDIYTSISRCFALDDFINCSQKTRNFMFGIVVAHRNTNTGF